MVQKGKYFITPLLIVAFLCQNFSWAYGRDKLAPSSRVDDPSLRAAAAAYAEMLTKQGKPKDPDDDTPPRGSVLRSIIAFLLIPTLFFMWLISPINVNTAFAKSSPPAVQVEIPQWIVQLKEALRLERLSQQPYRYGVGLQYDSLGGGYVSGNADFGSGSWGVGGIAGFGNPLFGLGEEGVGGIGTFYLRLKDNLWVSFRGGQLPDYSPDPTYFSLVGIDAELFSIFHPYLHAGALNRRIDGVSGKATGILLDAGINAKRGRFEGGLSASGPLYFKPTVGPLGTIEDYRRVMGDISLLKAGLGYDGRLWWVRGKAEVGGTESRLDNRLPSNRFSRFGVDAGLRFDLGQVNAVLSGSVQQANPSFTGEGRVLAGSAISLTWRDLSLRGGLLYGPFVRPYAEVLYRIMEGLEVKGGYNPIPPLYTGDFYDSPWGPQRNLFTFGLTGNLGASARQRVYPSDEYPVQSPTGTAMDRFVYGPFEPPSQAGVKEKLDEAQARFEKLLTSAVSNAKTVNEVYNIFKKLQELIDPESIVSLSAFGTFWDAYYNNPNLDFYWVYFIREKIQPEANEYKYWHELYKHSYGAILERLVNRRYEVPDYKSLQSLISEFDQLMTTILEGVDKEVLNKLDSLFKIYMSRLEETKPGSPEFVFAYYVASRLFYILGRHDMYPDAEAFSKLVEAYLMIPLDLVRLDADMLISNKKIIEGLRLQYMNWILQGDPRIQIQGILVWELLLLESGGAVEINDDLIVRLYEIFRKVFPSPGEQPAPEPLKTPTLDDEYYLERKAAALALDFLIRIDMPIYKEDLERFRIVYNNLPPHLRERLSTDNLKKILEKRPREKGEIKRPPSGTLGKYAGRLHGFLLPIIAGLFLTGCSGTGIVSVVGIGMLLVLAAAVSMEGSKPTATPQLERKTYKPTRNKAVNDFIGTISDKKIILALDTDIGNLKDSAISLLATLVRLSRSGKLGGITFIRASGSKLRDKIEKAIGEDRDANIVLVCKDTNKERFDGLENVFITSVNDSNRVGIYIPILEILTLSLRMASKATIDEVRGLYREITNQELTEELYAIITNGLLLPIRPKDYETLRGEYEAQNKLLLSA